MGKFKLVAEPTFKATVNIPVAGGDSEPVEFTFKHRTKDQLEKFIKSRVGKDDEKSFMEMVIGWEFKDKFDKKNVDLLLQNYAGAGLATFNTYLAQLVKGREGN